MPVGHTFNEFRNNVKEVARPNRFLLSLVAAPSVLLNGETINLTESMKYHVRSASLPPRTLGEIANLLWFGLNYKIAGDPSFDDYPVTFLNNANWGVKNMMERWMSGITDPIKNERSSPDNYKGVIKLEQFGPVNQIIATYFLHGVWPKSMDSVELSQESVDAVEDFSVVFSIDYWSGKLEAEGGRGVGAVSAIGIEGAIPDLRG